MGTPTWTDTLLTPVSRAFARRLFARYPYLLEHARMIPRAGSAELDLQVELNSPANGEDLRFAVFMVDDEPSVGFGPWHTHAGLLGDTQEIDAGQAALLDLIEAIFQDRFVVTNDVGGRYDGSWGVLDLRKPEALAEALTSRHSSGRMRIRSWRGSADRELGLEDLTL